MMILCVFGYGNICAWMLRSLLCVYIYRRNIYMQGPFTKAFVGNTIMAVMCAHCIVIECLWNVCAFYLVIRLSSCFSTGYRFTRELQKQYYVSRSCDRDTLLFSSHFPFLENTHRKMSSIEREEKNIAISSLIGKLLSLIFIH